MSRELTFLGHPQPGTTLGGPALREYRAPGPPVVRGVPAGWVPTGPTFKHTGSDPWEPLVDELVDVVTNAVTSAMTARFRTG